MAVPTFNPDNVTMMDAKTGSIPTSASDAVLTDIKHGSAFMQLAKAIEIDKPEKEFMHMSGVGAYWVDEAERIKTSKPTWLKTKMTTKKIGVIIPTTKENLRYSVTNFFELMRPEIAEAFYKLFDAAAFSGTNSPFAWNIKKSAEDSSHVVTETDNKYNDLNDAMAFVEESDFDPNGIASLRKQKSKYRATKDSNGMPIFNDVTSDAPATILGLPIAFMHNSAFQDDEITEIIGDWNNAYYGILEGIEYEILTEATLTTIEASDAPGKPVSLAERDMVALKATMSIGMMIVKDEAFSIVTKTVTP